MVSQNSGRFLYNSRGKFRQETLLINYIDQERKQTRELLKDIVVAFRTHSKT